MTQKTHINLYNLTINKTAKNNKILMSKSLNKPTKMQSFISHNNIKMLRASKSKY